MRKKSADSLIHALRMGDEIRADGVVLHPGSTVGEPQDEALPRVGEMVKHALSESERLPPAAREHRRRRQHDRPLVRGAARADRPRRRRQAASASASTPATCSPPASTSRRPTSSTEVVDSCAKIVGMRRLRCLHVNDSLTAARLEPRPPRPARRRRDRPPRLRGLPVGAALREAAGALRGPGRERPRAREGGRGQDEEAARAGPALAQAAPLAAEQARRHLDDAVDDGSAEQVEHLVRPAGRCRSPGRSAILAGVMSPLRSKRKSPRTPFFTTAAAKLLEHRGSASRRSGRSRRSTTSVACAAGRTPGTADRQLSEVAREAPRRRARLAGGGWDVRGGSRRGRARPARRTRAGRAPGRTGRRP